MPAQQPAKKSAQPTNSGIVTDKSGDRFIPESQRADGSTRKAIKIRPGFRPTEDVELYRSRGVEARERPRGIPGAAPAEEPSASAASNKNAKRREARKKAKEAAAAEGEGEGEEEDKNKAGTADGASGVQQEQQDGQALEQADPQVETAKKARAIKKKLRQARELQNKKEDGQALLPEQIAKVIKINELVRELEALGLGEEDEAKDKDKDQKDDKDGKAGGDTKG